MYKALNPLLHSELRLGAMSLLVSLQEADFNYILEQTKSTPGNLSVQIDKLQKANYIDVIKTYKGKRPQTICKITLDGIAAFEEYVVALRDYIDTSKTKM